MADVVINFSAQTQRARQNLSQLEREVQNLRQRLGETSASARQAASGVDDVGDQAQRTAGQVRTVNATFEGLEARMNDSRRAALTLRDRMNLLNAELAENRKALLTADTAQKGIIDTRNRAIRVNQGLLRSETQRNSAVLAGLTQERRELGGLSGGYKGATGATGLFARASSELAGTLGAIGIAEVGFRVVELTRNSINAAVKIESFTQAFSALGLGAAGAERRIAELQEISDLPGVNFEQAVQGAIRLRVIGIEGERANSLITQLGNALALTGDTDLSGAIRSITQIIQLQRVNQEEINQLVERSGAAAKALQDVFGTTRAEEIQAFLDASGKGVQDFVDLLTEGLSRQARVSTDTAANAFQNLQNASFRLSAELGERLLPIVGRTAEGITDFFNRITEYLDAPRSAAEATETFIASLNSLNTQLSDNQPLESRNQAIETYIDIVEDQIEVLERFAQSEARQRGRQTFALRGVDSALLVREEDVAAILELSGELELLQGVLTGSALAIDHFQSQADDLNQSITIQQQEIARLTQEQRALAISGESGSTAYRNLNRDIIEASQVLDALRTEAMRVNSVVKIAESNFNATALSSQLFTASQEAAAQAVKDGTVALEDGATAYGEYVAAAIRARENLESLSEAQEVLNVLWMVASGQVEDYSTSIEIVIPSLINFQNEQDALNAAIQSGIDVTNEAVGDPLTDYINSIGLTSEAADNARSNVEKASDAVVDLSGDAADAESGLRDFDDAFQLSEATIPKVTSAMREFTGTAPDVEKVERAVEQTTRSVDDLLNEVDRVPGEVEDAFSAAERSIFSVLDEIPGFLIDIAQDDADITEAFGELGDRIGQSLIDELSGTLTDQAGAVITEAISGAGAGGGAGAGAGAGGGAAAGIISLLTSPVALAAIVPAAVFFATKYIGDQFGQTGTIDDPNRQGRPSQVDPLRRRGESQAAFEARIGVGTGVDPDDPTRTATRDGTRRIGTGASTPGRASVSEGRQRRGAAGEEPSPTSPFGTSTATQPTLRALTDVQSAYIQSLGFDPSQYGYDSRRNAFVKTAGGDGPTLLYDDSVAFDEARTPQAPAGSELGTPSITATAADPRTTFSFTGDERAALEPYLADVRDAEDAITDLTEDSTPQEIADAYQALVFAQTNLSNISEGIIRAAEETGRITGTAATNAIRTLESDLGDDLRTANTALISTLGDVGFEVVGGIENIREAIDVSDISSVFRMIPAEVEAAAEPEPEPEADPLISTFRFTGDQRDILRPLVGNVTAAQDFIDNFLTEDSSPEEIRDAYADLTDAETALYDQKVAFILTATGITEAARGRALTVERQIFHGEIRDANADLVDAFSEIGLQLVTALTFTSGILRGTALATQQIPAAEETAAEETAADAETDDPLPGLRSTASLAANQVRRARTSLGLSTSEADFETNRVNLIQAANVAYTAQIALLDALGLSEAEYQNRVEDAEDTRDGIIRRATTAVNTFAATRIKGEEDAAKAAQDAADDATAAAEKAARDQMRIAERQQRDIQDLKDDAFEAEERRGDRLVDLEQDTQDRILDIQRNANRSAEDIAQDFLDDNADLRRAFIEDQGDVADALRRGDIDSQEANRQISELSRGFIGDQVGLQRERDRDLRDVGIRTGRRTEDAETRQLRGERDINAQAEATATAIQASLDALVGEQSPLTHAAEMQTTAVEAQTAAAENVVTAVESLPQMLAAELTEFGATGTGGDTETQGVLGRLTNLLGVGGDLPQAQIEEYIQSAVGDGGGFSGVGTQFDSDSEAFQTLRERIDSANDLAIETGLTRDNPDIIAQQQASEFLDLGSSFVRGDFQQQQQQGAPQLINLEEANIRANNVYLSGDIQTQGGGGAQATPQQPMIVVDNNITLEMDNKEVGKAVGPVIAQQRNVRRNL